MDRQNAFVLARRPPVGERQPRRRLRRLLEPFAEVKTTEHEDAAVGEPHPVPLSRHRDVEIDQERAALIDDLAGGHDALAVRLAVTREPGRRGQIVLQREDVAVERRRQAAGVQQHGKQKEYKPLEDGHAAGLRGRTNMRWPD